MCCRWLIQVLAGLLWLQTSAADIHQALEVELQPDNAGIRVTATVTLPPDHPGTLSFALHPALRPILQGDGATLTAQPEHTANASPQLNQSSATRPRLYRIELADTRRQFTLAYQGRIAHALQQRGEDYARSFQETRGIISPQGVFLAGASSWYPQFGDSLLTFDLEVHLPSGWKSMSQGTLADKAADDSAPVEHWRAVHPQEEIYLIAGPFSRYTRVADGVTAMVLLRAPDTALAHKYLDATHRYIALYSELIGAYPFGKFALVENFWETGYGMPSFTLLGSRVIRFPFILHSSYPHEILHNWWGNSVYVDYVSGNWAEGLTSYLADHLIKEQRGGGSDYRRNTLQKYTDYVGRRNDFPLTEFRSRHSARTEAVGYGKTLMLFHMLRRELGDERFRAGLRRLYTDRRFQVASFADVQRSFTTVSDAPLEDFFAQWVQRSGAPQLRVSEARAQRSGDGFRLTAQLEQVQDGPVYRLRVPVAVTLQSTDRAFQTDILLDRRQQTLSLDLPARPLQLAVDPEFDLFRRLHRNEIPPAVSQAMGAPRVLVVLPGEAPSALQSAYRRLAQQWQRQTPEQVDIALDSELETLPADRAIWLFGWRNRFRPQLEDALQAYDFATAGDGVRIAGTELQPRQHSLAVIARLPGAPEQAFGWLAADSAAALPGLGRKLPHYGRYSYLGFSGPEPDNRLKGQWPVVDSPMTVDVVQADAAAVDVPPMKLAPRKPLAAPPTPFSAERMRRDIAYLADDDMQGRALGSPQLQRAAAYIETGLRDAGLQPGGDDGGYLQTWEHHDSATGRRYPMANVIAVLPGSNPEFAGQSLVIGAHYDHLGLGEQGGRAEYRGRIHPGADDNGSGIAVLLELARSLQGKPLPRTLVFVAFAGEESGLLGSRHFVRHTPAYPPDGILAMLNLDTVGRLGERPLIVFGSGSAAEWAHIFRGAAHVTGVRLKTVDNDFGSGDQTAFIEAGVPAVQLFSGNHADVHAPGDTPDRIDAAGLVRVAKVLNEAVRYLAERPARLTASLSADTATTTPAAAAPRRVSFGTVPDFTFAGDGVRLDDVREGTPAQRAGLRRGDIIVAVNATPVDGMRAYSDALKQLEPGDEIEVRFIRDGVEQSLRARVVAR